MIFLLKVVIICSIKKIRFDYKNNHGYGKLDNFWLDTISKINFKMLKIILYILLMLKFRKIQPI